MLQPNEIYLNGNNSTVQIASAHETSKTFSYNGNEVLFDIKDDVMVNATQLAKIYGNSLTFDEVADKLGCSVEDLQKIALENGLIDENGNPTEMAIREGLFSQYATMEDEYGTVNITVSHSEYDMIAVCISDPEDHERDSVAFISREKAHALGEYLLNM